MLKRENGQSLVETALVLPFLLLLLAGIIDLGFAFHGFIVLANASREGARYASKLSHDVLFIERAVRREAAGNGLDVEAIGINVVFTPAGGSLAGHKVQVVATYDLDTVLGRLLGADVLTIRVSTVMVVFGSDV